MALALLTVMLRHRDGWDITLERIGRRYGYGEDAMAGAMGLLQAARYVVKVRYMRREGNLWATEVAVYDEPATDAEVDDLLAAIEEENPDARHVEVIPPTRTALDKAAKRRAKIIPRLREFQDSGPTCENTAKPQVAPDSGVSRDPGDPGVTKKTNSKKTNDKNTLPATRPSAPAGSGVREAPAAWTDGGGTGIDRDQEDEPAGDGMEGGGVIGDATPAAAPETQPAARAGGAPAGGAVRVDASPGVNLLQAIAGERPDLLLEGRTLRDQGLMVTGLLEAGWPVPLLRELIMRPLPDPLEKTVGAVISYRLRSAARIPVPSSAGGATVPHQAASPDRPVPGEEQRREDGETPTPARWKDMQEEHEQLRRGIDRNPGCEADDGLCPTLAVVGETQCAEHLGWPLCPGFDEHPCSRRTRDGAQCAGCRDQELHARLADVLPLAEPDDGTCPGHTGACGRTAMPGDRFCARCRIASQRDRDRIQQEWEAALEAAVAVTEEQQAPEVVPAPF